MSLNDYVKFITEQAVKKMDQPREERLTKKQERKAGRQPLSTQAFGMIPLGISLLLKRKKKEKITAKAVC